MEVACPECGGGLAWCSRCQGTGRAHLTRLQRRDLVVEVLERRGTIGNRDQLLYFRVVTKAVSDLAHNTMATDERFPGESICDGGLAPFLYFLDLSEDFLVEVLEDAGLLRPTPVQLTIPFPQ